MLEQEEDEGLKMFFRRRRVVERIASPTVLLVSVPDPMSVCGRFFFLVESMSVYACLLAEHKMGAILAGMQLWCGGESRCLLREVGQRQDVQQAVDWIPDDAASCYG